MSQLLMMLLIILLPSVSLAAGFDCGKATTNIEKLICSNTKLSGLDEELNKLYQYVLNNYGSDESSQMVSAQKLWLKLIRNKCNNEACLAEAYSARIKEINDIDPFIDGKITCEEMKRHPDKIFQDGIDLGSGSGSPIDVDYRCAESLASLPFLQRLYTLTESIRNEGGPQLCTGSIIHAHWRYYHFDLLRAGFTPERLAHADDSDTPKYFEQWSWESPYNFQLRKDFLAEFEKALPLLARHYKRTFGVSEQESQTLARSALMIFMNRAAGTFPKRLLKEETGLVALARDEQSSLSDLKNELAKGYYSTDQAYFALKVAFYRNKPQPFISTLVEYIGQIDDKELGVGDESALFAALTNHENVQLLLDKGELIDYANSFGKTALYYAIGFTDHNLVEILLRRGANVNHTYKSAKELNPDNDPCSPNTYLKHTKRTPLMHAAQNSDVEMIKLLLKHGARLNDIDEIGFTAFDYAIMGDKHENQAYLKSIGAKLGNPIYPSDATNQPLPISAPLSLSNISINGYVNKLAVSSQRPDILVASVIPYDKLIPDENHGLYLFSISNPTQPRMLAHFPSIKPQDFALSAGGKTAYVMNMGFKGAPSNQKYGLFVIDIADPTAPHLAEFIPGDFMTMHLSQDDKHLYLQERDMPTSPARGILVFSTEQQKPQLLCSNPFAETQYARRPFAYSFATFPDEALIAIREQLGGISLYDISNPCDTKIYSKYLIKT